MVGEYPGRGFVKRDIKERGKTDLTSLQTSEQPQTSLHPLPSRIVPRLFLVNGQ